VAAWPKKENKAEQKQSVCECVFLTNVVKIFFFVHVKLHQGVLVFFSLSKSIDFAGMCTSIADCWCMGKEFFIFNFFKFSSSNIF